MSAMNGQGGQNICKTAPHPRAHTIQDHDIKCWSCVLCELIKQHQCPDICSRLTLIFSFILPDSAKHMKWTHNYEYVIGHQCEKVQQIFVSVQYCCFQIDWCPNSQVAVNYYTKDKIEIWKGPITDDWFLFTIYAVNNVHYLYWGVAVGVSFESFAK